MVIVLPERGPSEVSHGARGSCVQGAVMLAGSVWGCSAVETSLGALGCPGLGISWVDEFPPLTINNLKAWSRCLLKETFSGKSPGSLLRPAAGPPAARGVGQQ